MRLTRRKFILSTAALGGGLLGHFVGRPGARQPAHSEPVQTGKPCGRVREIRRPAVKVIGIGGSGCNAVRRMSMGMGRNRMKDVEFICAGAGTDMHTLSVFKRDLPLMRNSVLTCDDIANSIIAGADPELGRQAAMNSRDKIAEALSGADMVLIVAGLGGSTGTGAAPVVAEVAQKLGLLTVAVVSCPFGYEDRSRVVCYGHRKLSLRADALVSFHNDDLLGQNDVFLSDSITEKDSLISRVKRIIANIARKDDRSLAESFRASNDVLMELARHFAANPALERYPREFYRHAFGGRRDDEYCSLCDQFRIYVSCPSEDYIDYYWV